MLSMMQCIRLVYGRGDLRFDDFLIPRSIHVLPEQDVVLYTLFHSWSATFDNGVSQTGISVPSAWSSREVFQGQREYTNSILNPSILRTKSP